VPRGRRCRRAAADLAQEIVGGHAVATQVVAHPAGQTRAKGALRGRLSKWQNRAWSAARHAGRCHRGDGQVQIRSRSAVLERQLKSAKRRPRPPKTATSWRCPGRGTPGPPRRGLRRLHLAFTTNRSRFRTATGSRKADLNVPKLTVASDKIGDYRANCVGSGRSDEREDVRAADRGGVDLRPAAWGAVS